MAEVRIKAWYCVHELPPESEWRGDALVMRFRSQAHYIDTPEDCRVRVRKTQYDVGGWLIALLADRRGSDCGP